MHTEETGVWREKGHWKVRKLREEGGQKVSMMKQDQRGEMQIGIYQSKIWNEWLIQLGKGMILITTYSIYKWTEGDFRMLKSCEYCSVVSRSWLSLEMREKPAVDHRLLIISFVITLLYNLGIISPLDLWMLWKESKQHCRSKKIQRSPLNNRELEHRYWASFDIFLWVFIEW